MSEAKPKRLGAKRCVGGQVPECPSVPEGAQPVAPGGDGDPRCVHSPPSPQREQQTPPGASNPPSDFPVPEPPLAEAQVQQPQLAEGSTGGRPSQEWGVPRPLGENIMYLLICFSGAKRPHDLQHAFEDAQTRWPCAIRVLSLDIAIDER